MTEKQPLASNIAELKDVLAQYDALRKREDELAQREAGERRSIFDEAVDEIKQTLAHQGDTCGTGSGVFRYVRSSKRRQK